MSGMKWQAIDFSKLCREIHLFSMLVGGGGGRGCVWWHCLGGVSSLLIQLYPRLKTTTTSFLLMSFTKNVILQWPNCESFRVWVSIKPSRLFLGELKAIIIVIQSTQSVPGNRLLQYTSREPVFVAQVGGYVNHLQLHSLQAPFLNVTVDDTATNLVLLFLLHY